MAPKDLKLPLTVTGKPELRRLLRELTKIDDFFVNSAAEKNPSTVTQPRMTPLLNEIAAANQINLLEAAQRKNLINVLNDLLQGAPAINISFATEPSSKALEPILVWLRKNIHPQVLLQVGLQPSIAAGCVLRTPNKIFDMSINARLNNEKEYLARLIDGATNGRG